ncbi:hypothetical protein ACH9L7_08065 [Haloferax sp. S1W]
MHGYDLTDGGGYQSHVLGSRNLDGGLSGRFADGDQTGHSLSAAN